MYAEFVKCVLSVSGTKCIHAIIYYVIKHIFQD